MYQTPRLDAFGYQVGRVLGEGGFGVVREAHDAITGKKVLENAIQFPSFLMCTVKGGYQVCWLRKEESWRSAEARS